MITEIKKGDQFVCIKDVVMNKPKDVIAYKLGKEYSCDGIEALGPNLPSEIYRSHTWDLYDPTFSQHFIPGNWRSLCDHVKTLSFDDRKPFRDVTSKFASAINSKSDLEHESFKQDLEAKEANASIAPEYLPSYYDNSKGSLYKIAQERGWSPYTFDVVKRLDQGGKKYPLEQEIRKSIGVLTLWLKEIER